VNQASGVSVRMSIANYETLAANALRRALRAGEDLAVPRVSDLDALETSTLGKIELEYAGGDRSGADVVRELRRRACKRVFDRHLGPDALAPVVGAFEEGWKVEVSQHMPSAEYLDGLERIAPLREAAVKLAGGEEPAALASAIEFLLEGLHLSNRLNKTEREQGARYASP
jgi:magnesium chelatase subunit I